MSLRDLINKSKQEKANANISSQTVQPQAEQKAAQETKSTIGTVATQVINTNTAGNIQPAVVEQGPPKGLTGLALIRWKKENAAKLSKFATNTGPDSAAKIPDGAGPLRVASEEKPAGVSPNTGNSPPSTQSASGLADSQKTNSGTADITALKTHLTFLENNIGQKEIVAQVVRTIAIQLQNSPELVKGMSNAEVDTVVRGLRSAYNIAARKKSENKEAKQKKGADTSALHAAFNDAGLGELTAKMTSGGKITF